MLHLKFLRGSRKSLCSRKRIQRAPVAAQVDVLEQRVLLSGVVGDSGEIEEHDHADHDHADHDHADHDLADHDHADHDHADHDHADHDLADHDHADHDHADHDHAHVEIPTPEGLGVSVDVGGVQLDLNVNLALADLLSVVGNHAHVYGHPEVRLDRVEVKGVYLRPSERAVSPGWQQDVATILKEVETLHEREFGGRSELNFSLFGPIAGRKSTAEYRALAGDGAYLDMVFQVRDLDLAGGLGAPAAKSSGAPFVGAPNVTVYLVFADWGENDATPVVLQQYFVRNAPAGTDLSDIRQAGGSRGAYWDGWDPLFGAGLVTEEAWKHPEIPGSASVAYHEGPGHGLNMPHSNPPDPNGVMGLGHYAGINLSESYVEPSILSQMFTAEADLTGPWAVDRELVRVNQAGGVLTFVKHDGGTSAGVLVGTTQVISTDLGNLIGTIGAEGTISWSNGKVWRRVDLTGPWTPSSGDYEQFTYITQIGNSLTFVNRAGGVSTGAFAGPNDVVASDWGVSGTIDLTSSDAGRIVWSNGIVWVWVSLGGQWAAPNGSLTSIVQNRTSLTIVREGGGSSAGEFLSPTQIAATNWPGLTGTFSRDGTIIWSNADVWRKLSLSPNYTTIVGNAPVFVIDNGTTTLTFVNRLGGTALGNWINSTQVIATGFGNIIGTIADGTIQWSNGAVWNKNLAVQGTPPAGGTVGIAATNAELTLTNRLGQVSAGRIIGPNQIQALGFGITGTRQNGRIIWSNGAVWENFEFNALDAVFSDVRSFPFGY